MKYQVTVKPGSFRDEVIEVDEGELVVKTRKKAHDGEANKAVIELLAKHFGAPKTKVQIMKGVNSRQKTIEVLRDCHDYS